jgi:carboxylesterase
MKKVKSFLLKGDSNIGVLLLHGWTSPNEELFPLAKYLNSSGYTVSAPLLLGHGTRPEDLAHVKWKDWLRQSREALVELKKHLSLTTSPGKKSQNKNYAEINQSKKVVRDEAKIFVGGISMGGQLAMLLAEDESVAGIFTMGAAMKYKFHRIAKVVLFFMGLTKTYRRKYYPPWVREQMKDRKVYMYYPIESAKEVVRLSDATMEFLPRIKKPILIMQSTTDHMVTKKSPRMIFDGVKSKTKEIFWIENAYHVFAGDKKVWKKIGEFVEEVTKTQTFQSTKIQNLLF